MSDIRYLSNLLRKDVENRVWGGGWMRLPSSERARSLLLLLTGEKFETEDDALRWLDRHPNLRWNQAKGSFVDANEEPTSHPSEDS